ncbi:MAG TPA: type II secretion system F family protein [bacterium]|jgi:type II secretory pathway component PulF|nr:type II secretion system F family protein [bacterium]
MSFITQQVAAREKEFFAKQLAIMLESGLPLSRAIDVVFRQTRDKYFKRVLGSVAKSLQNGRQLSRALSDFPHVFSPDFIAVLRAGEQTGKLDLAFYDLGKKLEADNTFRAGVLGAVLYPLLIVFAIFAVSTYMVIAVVPNLVVVFEQNEISLPFLTRAMIAIVTFANNYWWLIIVFLLVLVLSLRYYSKTKSGKLLLSYAQIKVPLAKDLYEAIYVSSFAHTLSMLVRHGVPIIEAMRVTKGAMRNVLYRVAADEMMNDIEKGIPLSKPIMGNKIFPPLLGQMVLVGEQTGKLDEALESVATNYHNRANQIIKYLSSLIEPVLLILVGVIVALVVFAILLPIYQVAQL